MNRERLLEIKGEIDQRAANAAVLEQLFDLLVLDALIEESFESIEDKANDEPTD